jgi:hypothetical protein
MRTLAMVAGLAMLCTTGCFLHAGASSQVLRSSDDRENAKFREIANAVEKGECRRAERLAEEINPRDLLSGNGVVLAHLCSRRGEVPTESWTDSFAFAWRDASDALGLGASRVPLADIALNRFGATLLTPLPDDREAGVAKDAGALLIAVVAGQVSQARVAELCIANSIPERSVGIRLLAYAWLASFQCEKQESDTVCQRANSARHRIARDLSREDSQSSLVPLDVTLESVEGTMTRETIGRLKLLAERPRLLPPRSSLYREYKELLTARGVDDAELWAAVAVDRVYLGPQASRSVPQLERLAAATPPSERAEVAGILRRLGKAYLQENILEYWGSGARLLRTAARLTSDSQREGRARFLELYAGLLLGRVGGAASLELWPVPPLRREVVEARMRDEMSLYARLTGVSPPPSVWTLLVDQ